MCGIVGLFLKDPGLEPELGLRLAGMLAQMSDRGPDSAGFAIYGSQAPGRRKLTLRPAPGGALEDLARLCRLAAPGAETAERGSHLLVLAAQGEAEALRARLALEAPGVVVVGEGAAMEVYKEVGRPEAVAAQFGLSDMSGTHAIGHTRMATESAVTTEGAHPFSTGLDQCLVHNGSLSNHNNWRRILAREGLSFETDNDSEVAAAYLTWRMGQGASLGEALEASLADLDGFFTFVVGSRSGFGVLRDRIACKPAIMAETDAYVAFGSEYRALSVLPAIAEAKVWEPVPGRAYFWERAPDA